MTIHYRKNQSTPLTCDQLDSNFDTIRDRSNHTGTQLASTISDLESTVEGYDFITDLKDCCDDLNSQFDSLQDTLFGDGELTAIINDLKNQFDDDIAGLSTDLSELISRVTILESSVSLINSNISSLSSSVVGLQNTKANINNPTLTGVPRAPVPLLESNNNQIATTSFVKALFATIEPCPPPPEELCSILYGPVATEEICNTLYPPTIP